MALHPRSYDRNRDFENPEHARELLARKRRAEEPHLRKRFLAISPLAETDYRQLAERKIAWRLHLRKIVAMADALTYHAFASDYVANILEHRASLTPEPGPLHLACKQDLLGLDLPAPDLSVYDTEPSAPGDCTDEART